MGEEHIRGLRPLRIPSGWEVRWNTFYDVDPEGLSKEELNELSEDILLLVHRCAGVVPDLGWYGSPGHYRLEAFRWFDDTEQMRQSLSQPLQELVSRSTDEIAQTIDAWLTRYSDIFYKVPPLRHK